MMTEHKINVNVNMLCNMPHKKRNVVRLQTQSQLARGMTKLIELPVKRYKEQMKFEKERDRAFLKKKKGKNSKA